MEFKSTDPDKLDRYTQIMEFKSTHKLDRYKEHSNSMLKSYGC